MMGFSAIQTFLPLYAFRQAKMSTVEIGVVIAGFAAVQLVAMPLLGWLSDRFGQKRVAVAGLVLSACSFLLYFIAGTSYQIFLVSVAVGVGLSGTSLLLAMIPDVAPKGMYGTAIGLYGSFEDLGIILGPLFYGFVWSSTSPVYVFAASSFTQILCAVLVLAIEQKRRGQYL
jgi:MFS family permease